MENSKKKKSSPESNLPDDDSLYTISQLFAVLSDVTRLKIVMTLKNNTLCVQDIATAVKMSVSAVSHQLRLLKTMKLVKFKKAGKMKYYSLDDNHIEQLLKVANEHVDEQ
jgi:DNA-binding transcriptional ArsR family regulator